jgi:hypothetical protein
MPAGYDNVNLAAVATLSSSAAIVGGYHADTLAAIVARVDRQGAFVPYSMPLTGPVGQLGFDRDHTVFGATDSGQVFQIDITNDHTLLADLGLPGGQLAVGIDGNVFFARVDRIFRLSAGSTRADDGTLFTAPAGLRQVKVVRRDRILALDDAGLETWSGTGWSPEYDGPEVAVDSARIAADTGTMGMFSGASAFLRDESQHSWMQLPSVVSGLEPRAIAALGPGRIMVVGNLGGVSVYDDGGWCSIRGGPLRVLWGAGASPDLRTAIAVSGYYTGPTVVWMDLPP